MATRNRDDLYWESYDGRKILIKDLDVRHLVNILNHVKETNDANPLDRDIYPAWVHQLLIAEAELRIMAGWAKDIGIPRKNEDGTWDLINQTDEEKAIEYAKTALHQAELAKAKNQRLSAPELNIKLQEIQEVIELEFGK